MDLMTLNMQLSLHLVHTHLFYFCLIFSSVFINMGGGASTVTASMALLREQKHACKQAFSFLRVFAYT